MSVYVDNFNARVDVPNGGRIVRGVWSHMMADTREELDAMADKIGMKRAWIQYPGTWKEHYDVTLTKKKLALAAGAVQVDSMDMARKATLQGQAAHEAFDGHAHDFSRQLWSPRCLICGDVHK